MAVKWKIIYLISSRRRRRSRRPRVGSCNFLEQFFPPFFPAPGVRSTHLKRDERKRTNQTRWAIITSLKSWKKENAERTLGLGLYLPYNDAGFFFGKFDELQAGFRVQPPTPFQSRGSGEKKKKNIFIQFKKMIKKTGRLWNLLRVRLVFFFSFFFFTMHYLMPSRLPRLNARDRHR